MSMELEVPMSPSPKPLKAKRVELKKRGIAGWIIFAILAFTTLAWLLPFYMALINSVKTESEFVNGGPLTLPVGIDLTNVIDFWVAVDFPRKLWNSILTSLTGALIAIVLSLLTAFAIGIGRVRGRFWILALFMIAFTIPQEALIYPFYNMAKSMGLYDNLLSVIVIYAVLSTAFGTYMLSSVLNEFPEEMIEAAKIDGASTWTILSQIVFPLLRPTMLVLFTFFFIYNWNEFLIPLVLLPSNDNQTVTVGLGVVFGQWTTDPTQLAAAALLGSLPSIIFFFIFQKSLMRGVTMGSTK